MAEVGGPKTTVFWACRKNGLTKAFGATDGEILASSLGADVEPGHRVGPGRSDIEIVHKTMKDLAAQERSLATLVARTTKVRCRVARWPATRRRSREDSGSEDSEESEDVALLERIPITREAMGIKARPIINELLASGVKPEEAVDTALRVLQERFSFSEMA